MKQTMREIRRRWPECLFVRRPTDRLSWSPLVGQPETGMSGTELEKALQWHDEFMRVFSFEVSNCPKMTWEETMVFLDRHERDKRGLPVQAASQ